MRRYPKQVVNLEVHKSSIMHYKGPLGHATTMAIQAALHAKGVKTLPTNQLDPDRWLDTQPHLRLVRAEWNLNGTGFYRFEVYE